MRVLVTGATGLLGRGVTAALAARGTDVVALVRPGSEPPPTCTALVHDLTQPFPPDRLSGVDCVVHLAHHPRVSFPEHATALHRLNTSSTQELLEAARRAGANRFVYASSGAVYGWSAEMIDEETSPRARDFYALTKLHAEAYVRTYESFLEWTIVRPFFPYGGEQRDRLVPRLVESIMRGDTVELRPGDRPRINPIYVDDAVDAIVTAAEGRVSGVLNLAGPDVVSIRELAGAIGTVLGRRPRFEQMDDELDGDLFASTNRLRAVLGRPLVPLAVGLERALTASASAPQHS